MTEQLLPPDDRLRFGEAVVRALRQFTRFSGRASVAEYWWFALFVVLLWGALYLMASIVGAPAPRAASARRSVRCCSGCRSWCSWS